MTIEGIAPAGHVSCALWSPASSSRASVAENAAVSWIEVPYAEVRGRAEIMHGCTFSMSDDWVAHAPSRVGGRALAGGAGECRRGPAQAIPGERSRSRRPVLALSCVS